MATFELFESIESRRSSRLAFLRRAAGWSVLSQEWMGHVSNDRQRYHHWCRQHTGTIWLGAAPPPGRLTDSLPSRLACLGRAPDM